MLGTPRQLFDQGSQSDRFFHERTLLEQGYTCIAGTDEVGRGPLAGPVVAASVVLPVDCDPLRYNDSKSLSHTVREELARELYEIEAHISYAVIEEGIIDRINILQASLMAMKQSLETLPVRPDFILVDGRIKVPVVTPQTALVKGDSRSASIAAASIIAKVTRDKIMCDYHKKFPQYGFDRNKGYPTKQHRQAIQQFGITPIHRRTFRGVREYLK